MVAKDFRKLANMRTGSLISNSRQGILVQSDRRSPKRIRRRKRVLVSFSKVIHTFVKKSKEVNFCPSGKVIEHTWTGFTTELTDSVQGLSGQEQ